LYNPKHNVEIGHRQHGFLLTINNNLKQAIMRKLITLFVLTFFVTVAYSQTITWAYLQWEGSTTITEGQSFEAGATVFADGLTNAVVSTTGEGMTCEIGYSSSNTDPSLTGWTWSSIPFKEDWGDNFYFQGTLPGLTKGIYFYTFRFKLGADPYKYAGTSGLWNGTSSVNKSFTVNPATLSHVTWAGLQWEATTTITQGQSFEAGAVAFADGLTNAVTSTTGEGIICEIGYSSSNTDPSLSGWTWSTISFNADWGDNFYFQGSVSGMSPGTYFYTFRFKLGTDEYVYAGTDGLWNGTSSVNKSFTVNPTPSHITWAYLQWEAPATITEGQSFEAGAVAFADGFTNAIVSTTGDGMICEIGYSSSNADPSSSGWTWSSVPFNADWGDNFYFQGVLSGVPAGSYFYTFRFKLGDDSYKYAGTNGLWNGTSSVNKSFTVNPIPASITWAYLQWEASTTISEGQSFEAGAVVFADGLTNVVNSTTGEGITSDIGYSSSNTDPSSAGWTWQSVLFNADWESNFYYQGFLTDVPVGEYFYTFRFKLGDDPYKYAGTDGLWNGTTSVNKTFTVNSLTDIASNEFKTPSISAHPNPVTKGVINLVLNNLTAGEYSFILVDMAGQVIQNNKLLCDTGTNIFNIPTTAAKGIYLLQLSSAHNTRRLNMKTVIE
jgi:hypothetical protein